MDVALSLRGPGGEPRAESDVLGTLFLPEILSAVVSEPGVHLLEVAPTGAEDTPGAYRLTVEVRPARPEDRWRVEAEAALQAGRDLVSRSRGEKAAEARGATEVALEAARRSGDAALEGKVLHYLADVDHLEGDAATALERLRHAADLRRGAGDLAGTHHSVLAVGQLLEAKGEYEEAGRAYREALDLARRAGYRKGEAKSLNNLGVVDVRLGRLPDAVEKFLHGLEIYRETGDEAERAKTMNNLGYVYRQRGRLDEGLELYQEALALARRRGDTENEVAVLNNLGVLYRVRGEIQRALETYQAGIGAARQHPVLRDKEADLHMNLGSLWDRLGYVERAMEHHQTALRLYREADDVRAEAGSLMRIAWLHESRGEPEKMLPLLDEALGLAQASDDVRTQALVLAATGRALLELGEPERAVTLCQRAVEMAGQALDVSSQTLALRNLGRALGESGEPEGAREALARALELSRLVGDPVAEAATRFALARVERREGKLKEARDLLESGLTQVETLRSGLANQEYKASYLAGEREHYVFLADLLLEMHAVDPDAGFDRRAFAVSERSRARSFVELLAEAVAGTREGIASELALGERRVTQQIAWAQRNLMRELARPRPDPEQTAALREELDGLQDELERLESELRGAHPRYAEMRYPRPADLEEVQRLLAPDAALVEYLLGEPASLLFVVTRDDFAAFRLPPASEINPLVQQVREAIVAPGRRSLGRYVRAGQRLYDVLIRPALPLLEQRASLRIAPDGDLYYLPFEALLNGSKSELSRDAYLVSRWAVSYVPSASALSEIRRHAAEEGAPPERSHDLLAFGDPALAEGAVASAGVASTRSLDDDRWQWRKLPGTREEIEAIARLFPPQRVETYVGEEARESLLKRRLGATSPRFLHLASHAFVDPRRPAYSAILMSPESGGDEDGLLQTHEVFRLAVPAELVVLSACETGLGRHVRGEGLIGLSRAFLYAGARSVAVSLWPVADRSTTQLMLAFYRELNRGVPKTEALRRAKLELADGTGFAHPYYWAPFVLMGDSS